MKTSLHLHCRNQLLALDSQPYQTSSFAFPLTPRMWSRWKKCLPFLVFILFEYIYFYLFTHLFCTILCADMSTRPYTSVCLYSFVLVLHLLHSANTSSSSPSILWLSSWQWTSSSSSLAAWGSSSSSSSTPLARASAPTIAFWQPVTQAAPNVACVDFLQMLLLFGVFCKCCKFVYGTLLSTVIQV